MIIAIADCWIVAQAEQFCVFLFTFYFQPEHTLSTVLRLAELRNMKNFVRFGHR